MQHKAQMEHLQDHTLMGHRKVMQWGRCGTRSFMVCGQVYGGVPIVGTRCLSCQLYLQQDKVQYMTIRQLGMNPVVVKMRYTGEEREEIAPEVKQGDILAHPHLVAHQGQHLPAQVAPAVQGSEIVVGQTEYEVLMAQLGGEHTTSSSNQ